MMIKKFKVVHPGVRFIDDIRALYTMGSDKACLGTIQALSATQGEYLDEDIAIEGTFETSLRKGLLCKFLSEGKVIEEMVEETKGEGPRDPYAHVDLPREGEEEKNYVIPNKEIGSPTIDWNKLTFEEKKKMMIGEELELERKKKAELAKPKPFDWNNATLEERKAQMKKEEEEAELAKPKVIDWNSMTPAERKAQMLKEEQAEFDRLANVEGKKPGVVKQGLPFIRTDGIKEPMPSTHVKVQEKKESPKKGKIVKVKKGKRIKATDLAQVVEKENGGDLTVASLIEKGEEGIQTFEEFDALKYQDKLTHIAQETNIGLLNDIMNRSTKDLIIVRAMKKLKALRG